MRTAAEQHRTALDQRHQTLERELRALNTRLDTIETRSQRLGGGERRDEAGELEQWAFLAWCRYGIERMPAEEVRALSVSTDSAGGYLVPQQFVTELDRNLVEISPLRSVARVSSTDASEVLLPKRTAAMTASWVGETTNRSGTQPTYDQQTISILEIACYVDVSNRLLEDSAFDLNAELVLDFAEAFAKKEGLGFIQGAGGNEPSGIISNADIETVSTAAAATIAADDLIDLYHALPSAYARRAVWAMNRGTMGSIRKLKDGDGRYIWQQPLTAGDPPMLLGRPIVEMVDLPNVVSGESPATDTLPIIFGDFQKRLPDFPARAARDAARSLHDPDLRPSALPRSPSRRRCRHQGRGHEVPEGARVVSALDPMASANAVDVPEAGDGFTLEFSFADCGKLQEKFGERWFADVLERVDRQDVVFLEAAAAIGGRKFGQRQPLPPDVLPLAELGRRVIDALWLVTHGKRFREWLAERRAEIEEAREQELKGPGAPGAGSPSAE
jgi:HK97 family phage major capsid protein